jgi:hypothetical protein
MRIAALALVAALAACNPSAPSGDAGGGLFPNLNNASYRAEATAYGSDGEAIPTVMMRSGNKMRMEMAAPQGQMAMVNNGDSGESFVLMTQGGRTMAISATQASYEDPMAEWNADISATATQAGTCSVAGESGTQWTQLENDTQNTACVTGDGIILRAMEGDRVTWETTSVQRGPQAPALFELPEGVEVMDLGAMVPGAGAVGGADVNAQVCAAMRNANAPAEAMARAGC